MRHLPSSLLRPDAPGGCEGIFLVRSDGTSPKNPLGFAPRLNVRSRVSTQFAAGLFCMTTHELQHAPSLPVWNRDQLRASMQRDRNEEPFRSFGQLALSFKPTVDYDMACRMGRRNILCAAWHGGEIEQGSEIVADRIAGNEFHYYAFIGHLKSSSPHPLHITSARFDEPLLLSLAQRSEMVVGIHGCSTAQGTQRVFIGGGADESVKIALISHLRSHGFKAGIDQVFEGKHHNNPCNRGARPGLQIEIPQDYLDCLVAREDELTRFSSTISGFLRTIPHALWRE